MAYLKNTAVYPAFSLENRRKLLIIYKIRKINILKNCSVEKKMTGSTELLEILCYCIFLLFYDGHLVQHYQLFNKFSWKRKGPALKLPQKEPLRSQRIGFVGQEC